MIEFLFVVTLAFIVYAVFTFAKSCKSSDVADYDEKPDQSITPETKDVEAVEEKPAVEIPETAVVETAVKAPDPKPEAAPKTEKPSTGSNKVRHPESGEIATIPSNYRFAKRWIKEALVSEGLLPKIYKNNELDDEANAKIKQALETLKTLENYKV